MKSFSEEQCLDRLMRLSSYWRALRDPENGGFYGYRGFDRTVDPAADKGGILHSRILWFFSALFEITRDPADLEAAGAAYDFITANLLDREYDGIYWLCRPDGTPSDTRKHVYNQAFAVYALSQYYKASGKPEALQLALHLFDLIETRGRDAAGYLEEFDRRWNKQSNEMLSENGVISDRTMNTHLHVLEAYTVLLQVSGDARVKQALADLLSWVHERIYDPRRRQLKVFFDNSWRETVNIRSYGHDIEATWLIDRAAHVLGDPDVTASTEAYTTEIAESILTFYSPDGMINETVDGVTDTTRIWWVQAETVLGFVNAYQKSDRKVFLNAALNTLDFIHRKVVDPQDGEWFWGLTEAGEPIADQPFVSPWKCPYHNGRMYIELVGRMRADV